MVNVFRGMIGYLFLILAVRLTGKRLGTQITPFDTVIIFFLGGTVMAPVLGDELSMTSAFTVVVGVALMYVLVGWLKQRSKKAATFLDGTPLLLVESGSWTPEVLAKMSIAHADVMAAARTIGLSTLDQIDYAVLERNGQISVIERSSTA